ncbi:MAG: long-chain fatty acid--CoA ligase [bacterium]|nr:long-chain fatty acid--CoA ligase [bacterium]
MSGIDLGAAHEPVQTVAGEARTFGDVLRLRVHSTPEAPANFEKRDGAWIATTWNELYEQTRRVAAGLLELGLEVGDRVAILGPTHAAWGTYDLGAQLAGLVTTGIYPHQSVEQIRYLLEHSESRVIFVDGEEELATVMEAADGNEHLRAIVPWSAELAARHAGDERVLSPDHFAGEPLTEEAVAERLTGVDPSDTAILIYTSGTTGPPKGAMITHANILSLLRSEPDIFRFYRDDLLLSFLPMAHATERVLLFYLRINTGVAAAFASSVGAVLAEVREVGPTVFGSVPRLFEKAYAKILSEIERKPAVVRRLFAWARDVGRERLPYVLDSAEVPKWLALRYAIADRLVFAKVHAAFGGRVRASITGAAPISYDILEFFWGAGMPVYEGYGMTEATVLTHITREGKVKLGTVGRAVPPTTCRIAEDGEVLLGGPFVFKGYYKNEEVTRETVVDGWLHSGDIGELDDEGYLRITDRKKHLIITAGGKNVAPANIERAIKTKSPLISQVHAHGDRRNYISALIAPSPLETLEWGAEHGVLSEAEAAERRAELEHDPTARSEALGHAMAKVVEEPEFQQLFSEPVRRGNGELARVERVRRFFVLGRDLSQEGGEMTPTMKMKRKAIEEKYADLFDRVYDDDSFAIDAGRE